MVRNSAHARQHQVGAFRRLDRDDVAIDDDHGLADIERAQRLQRPLADGDVGAVIRAVGRTPPRLARGSENAGRDLMRAEQAEAFLLEQLADAGQQMIVAAAQHAEHARQAPESGQIEPEVADARAQHGADEDDIAAAMAAQLGGEPAELAEMDPGMRPGFDVRAGEAAQREHHHAPAGARSAARATASGKAPPPQTMASGASSIGAASGGFVDGAAIVLHRAAP